MCVTVCPADTLEVIEGKCHVTGEKSIHCAQCAAVCPEGAIILEGVHEVAIESLTPNSDLSTLFRLMKARRSCRSYKETPVDRTVLEDLVKIGITAPSGTNQQRWAFTIVPDRKAMVAFAELIARFYEKLNKLAESAFLRTATKFFGQDALARYYDRYYETVRDGLNAWETKGEDTLFHGAPAGIVVSVEKGASCPGEDALLASQNILLAAEAMGLGTCLIGFAVEAMRRDPRISEALAIPKEENVYAVITLGHPAVKYARPAGRKPPTIRYF
jgi:nitroreductase